MTPAPRRWPPATRGAGGVGDSGIAVVTNPLSVHIDDAKQMTIQIVTLACAGDCVDVEAVASGGRPPYAFSWDDGSSAARRRVCPRADSVFTVTATDTAVATGEFPSPSQSAHATVNARVLACGDAGAADAGPDTTVSLCAAGVTPPFQLIDAAPSLATTTYTQMNGTLPDYTVDGLAVTVVGSWTKTVVPGTCMQLLLAGDMGGTQPIGFDNFLIVELRTSSGTASKRWYYGPAGTIVYTPTGQMLPTPLAPTVPGTSINPPIGDSPH